MAAAFEADVRADIQECLLKLDGVLHAAMDAGSSDVWIVRDPAHDEAPLDIAVRNQITALGIDPGDLEIRIAVPINPGPRRRVRLVSVERIDEHRRVTVKVGLEWEDAVHTGSASAEKGSAIELRTAARAAVDALEHLTGEDLNVRIIGVKPIRAFDSDLMVTSLIRAGADEQPLVGAVVVSTDRLAAVATAVLSALNRKLGNFLHTPD